MSLSARLSKRITIQKAVDGRDAAGQPIVDWVNVITDGDGKCWAEIKDISGKEYISSDAEQASVTTRITIRHRPGLPLKLRVLYGADVYKVAATLGQTGRDLLLMCSRGDA